MSMLNKTTARRVIEEVMNAGNLAALDELADETVVDHTLPPDLPPGRQGVKESIAMFRTAFPDLRCTIEDMIADGDKVATRYHVTGTHQSAFMGIPATGRKITTTGIDIMRFQDGKVVERWAVEDNLSLLQQLGVVEG